MLQHHSRGQVTEKQGLGQHLHQEGEEEGHRQARGEAAGLPRGVFERRVACCLPVDRSTFPRATAPYLSMLLHSYVVQ